MGRTLSDGRQRCTSARHGIERPALTLVTRSLVFSAVQWALLCRFARHVPHWREHPHTPKIACRSTSWSSLPAAIICTSKAGHCQHGRLGLGPGCWHGRAGPFVDMVAAPASRSRTLQHSPRPRCTPRRTRAAHPGTPTHPGGSQLPAACCRGCHGPQAACFETISMVKAAARLCLAGGLAFPTTYHLARSLPACGALAAGAVLSE